MKQYVFGADIGGTTVKLGYFTVEGDLLDKWEIPTRREEDGRFILPDVAESIEAKIAEKTLDKNQIAGVGIGVPGPVKDDGTVAGCVNLGWGEVNVEAEAEKLLGLPVKVGNDANMASLGEMWQGGGKGFQSIVMVTLGTGVGGGIIINGRMVSGTNGAGGEIGHICVDDTEIDTCGCGNRGCLEQYCSATGIAKMAVRELEDTAAPSSLRDIPDVTAKDVFDAAKEGDALALALVEKHGKILGRALAGIACVCDPEAFVIGGGVSKAGDILLDTIAKHYREHAFHASRDTRFTLASLGNDAGIYGCAEAILTK